MSSSGFGGKEVGTRLPDPCLIFLRPHDTAVRSFRPRRLLLRCFLLSTAHAEKFARWHRGMLEKGIYLAPSTYEAGFMSLAHTEEDVDATIAAAKEVMATL